MRLRLPPAPPVDAAVAATPPDRDRLLDALRGGSLAVVVLGHGAMGVVAWVDGVPRVGNVLAAIPSLQMLTWVLQVIPLFFLAGGAANAISWRRHHGGYAGWMWLRVRRLLSPVWAYLALMVPVAVLVEAAVPDRMSRPLLLLITQLLWFLGVYVVVTALTPLLVRASARPLAAGAVLVLITAAADAARFLADAAPLALITFVTVWSTAALLGMAFSQGRITPRQGLALAATGLTANVLLVALGPYPVSLVGMPGEVVSNVAPPTLVMLGHVLLACGIVITFAPMLRRALARVRVWRAVVAVNLVAMTLYLWHLPVLAGLLSTEHLLGLDLPVTVRERIGPVPAAGFWWASIPHWGVFAVLVLIAARLLWPLERVRIPGWHAPASERTGRAPAAAIGAVVLGVGILMLAGTGLSGFPSRTVTYAGLPISPGLAVALMLSGALLVRWAGAARQSRVRSASASSSVSGSKRS